MCYYCYYYNRRSEGRNSSRLKRALIINAQSSNINAQIKRIYPIINLNIEPAIFFSTISLLNIYKHYGSLAAVDDISLEIQEGEISGMVGPNGAGKTTTIECIDGLRAAESGSVRLLGLDPRVDRREVAGQIGIQLQESALPSRLRVHAALEPFGSFYPQRVSPDELLARLGLAEKRSAGYAKLSGGQKQRLFISPRFCR